MEQQPQTNYKLSPESSQSPTKIVIRSSSEKSSILNSAQWDPTVLELAKYVQMLKFLYAVMDTTALAVRG